MGDGDKTPLRLQFNPKVRLEFHGATITSDAGLLPIRELDDALGLTHIAADYLQESRSGRNIRHHLVPLLRQSIYSRLAGYDDTNDAERLSQDPAMRVVVGWQGSDRNAASTNTVSRFETETLTQQDNLQGLARMNPQWVEDAMAHTPHQRVILDMDSSESPVHGHQEGAAYNGHFECVCYHPLFLFNQFGDCEGATLRPGNVHSAEGWQELLEPVVKRYQRTTQRHSPLLQWPWHSGAVDQGGQVRPELDQTVLSQVRGQPGEAMAVRSGVQSGKLREKVGFAGGYEALDSDQSSD